MMSHDDPTNFREIKAGNIAAGILFRSSSPLTDDTESEKAIEAMAMKAGIKCILNLWKDDRILENLSKEVPWYHKLVLEKKVIGRAMTFTIPGVVSNEKKLKDVLQFMIAHEGPYLIHCVAGIDRTGFVATLLEALMGATLVEISDNYLAALLPVLKVYRLEDKSKLENYNKKKVFFNLGKIAHSEHLIGLNLQTAATRYLLNDIGLSPDEIVRLKGVLGTKTLA